MSIQLELTSHLNLGKGETSPIFHLFFSGSSDVVTVTPGRKTAQRLKLTFPRDMCDDAVLGIDLFTTQFNEDNVACLVRCAIGSVFVQTINRFYLGADAPPRLRMTLENPNDPTHDEKGVVILKVLAVDGCDGSAEKKEKKKVLRRSRIELAQTIRKSMGLFRAYSLTGLLRPFRSAFRNVHAPIFEGRTAALPGIAFWMTPPPFITEDCLCHMLDLVKARSTVVNLVASEDYYSNLLAEFCTAFPASLPYISDRCAHDEKKGSLEIESFDDLFVRGAGDCEDFAKAICKMFEIIQKGGPFQHPDLIQLQECAQQYIACSILGAVEAPQFGHKKASSAFSAHMYVKLFPKRLMYRWIGWTAPPETRGLRAKNVYVCEGTSRVRCNFSAPGTSTSSPQNMEEVSCPDLQHCAFYRRDIHAYTNYFIQDPSEPNIGVFTFTPRGSNRYGIPFTDTFTGENVRLHPHPELDAHELSNIRYHLRNEHPPAHLETPDLETRKAHQVAAAAVAKQLNALQDGASETVTTTGAAVRNIATSFPERVLTRDLFCPWPTEVIKTGGARAHNVGIEQFTAATAPHLRIGVI